MCHYVCAWPLHECQWDILSSAHIQSSKKTGVRGSGEQGGKVREGENSSRILFMQQSHKAQSLPGAGQATKNSVQKFSQVNIFKLRERPGNCVWGTVDV